MQSSYAQIKRFREGTAHRMGKVSDVFTVTENTNSHSLGIKVLIWY